MAAVATTLHATQSVELVELTNPCPSGLIEDLVDMALLMGVFCIGWLLVSFCTAKLGGTRLAPKVPAKDADLWIPAPRKIQPPSEDASLSWADSPTASMDNAEFSEKEMQIAEDKTFDWLEKLLPLDAGIVESKAHSDPISDVLNPIDPAYAELQVAAEDDLALVAGLSMAEIDSADDRLCHLAKCNDLRSCWHLWRCLPHHMALTSSTCDALAAAVQLLAASAADAEYALEAAAASGHEGLAEAALAAGVRLQNASWLAKAGAKLDAAGVPKQPSQDLALVQAYGHDGRADLAADLWLERAASEGFCHGDGGVDTELPESQLYGAALEACAASGDFAAAARLVRGAAWTAPSTAAGQAGEFFSELSNKDFTSFSVMVRGFCAAGDVEQAFEHFRAMRSHGFTPDSALFDALVSACAGRNMLMVAEEVIAEMVSVGTRPTSSTLAVLVRLHGARGALRQALEVFEELPRQHGFEADARAYHALISVCLSSSRNDLALEVFSSMSIAGVLPSAKTYEALINASLRHGSLDDAVALVRDAYGLMLDEPVEGSQSSSATPQRRAVLERRVIEGLLELAGRRRDASRIGLPLLEGLHQAGFDVSEKLGASLRRAAAREAAAAAEGAGNQTGAACESGCRAASWRQWREEFGASAAAR
mmetsp:Transcript_123116/g.393570  ORF Transcript_123116/g.393570 Transcript_123116/m.393570 type:complete len:653 (-) Transcript_123116:159-2117(-)